MTTQPARDPNATTRDAQSQHVCEAWDALFWQTFSTAGSTPFAVPSDEHLARFVSDALVQALLDTNDARSGYVLAHIHAERRRRMSAATREGRRG